MDLFIKPDKFIKNLAYIKPSFNVADFGCGSGYFTLEIAKKIGQISKVYAIDILKEPLINLKRKAEMLGIFNIKFVLSDLEKIGGSLLDNESVNCVFVANILFQVKHKNNLINEAIRIIQKNGYLILLEYENSFAQFGPPKTQRIPKKLLLELLNDSGMKLIEDFKPSESHYCLVYEKTIQ